MTTRCTKSDESDALVRDGIPLKPFQDMCGELEAIERTMEFLKAVLDSEGEGSLGLPHWLVVSDLLPVQLSLSVKLGFRFLKQVVKGHRGNAEDLATHLEFLASQLNQPFKARTL